MSSHQRHPKKLAASGHATNLHSANCPVALSHELANSQSRLANNNSGCLCYFFPIFKGALGATRPPVALPYPFGWRGCVTVCFCCDAFWRDNKRGFGIGVLHSTNA